MPGDFEQDDGNCCLLVSGMVPMRQTPGSRSNPKITLSVKLSVPIFPALLSDDNVVNSELIPRLFIGLALLYATSHCNHG